MTQDDFSEVGWPAEQTRVYPTIWENRSGAANPANRKRELFPARYDDRPLHVRALEQRGRAA